MRHTTISLVIAALLLGGCSSSRIPAYGRSIKGRVVDPQEQPLRGVEVRLGNRLVGITNRTGEFVIHTVSTSERLAVSFSAPKFMSTTWIYDTKTVSGGNTVVIWPRATPARLHASEGGKLTFSGGTVVFPPAAFADANGQPVTGDVDVSMSVLDIADPRQLASAPGDFTARMRDGSIQNLETFGLFELVITDGKGRRVDLARDRGARVEMNVSKGRREVPQSVGSFSFDEQTGRWVELASTWQSSTVSTVSTLSTVLLPNGPSGWWNADQAYDTTCLKVRVLGCRGCEADSGPITGADVWATGTNYTGQITKDTTLGPGEVCLPVKKGATVQIDVKYAGLYSNPLEVSTDPNVLDPAICTSCPLVTATHVVDPPIATAPLTVHDVSKWCRSNYWNGSTTEFENAWLDDASHVGFSLSSGLTLTLNNMDPTGTTCSTSLSNCGGAKYASGEYKTNCFHGYGTYTATITPPAWRSDNGNSGIVTGFFTFTRNEPSGLGDGTIGENNPTSSWDEVDLELLGRHPISSDCDLLSACDANNTHQCQMTDLVVHTNYFGKGQGNHEKDYCLPYVTRAYSFIWTATSITWRYVDGNGVTQILRDEQRSGNPKWPTQPGRVFMNLWANNTGQSWVGTFAYPGVPVQAVFKDVSVP